MSQQDLILVCLIFAPFMVGFFSGIISCEHRLDRIESSLEQATKTGRIRWEKK